MVDFKFADIGEGIHEGVVLTWNYKVGDTIEEGETLVLIETDKVNAEIPSPVTGEIKKLGPDEGETVHVGDTLALIDDGSGEEIEEETTDDVEEEKQEPISEGDKENSAGVVGEIEVSDEMIESSKEHSKPKKESTSKRILATPVARKMAKDFGVDLHAINGSGTNGRIMKQDIKDAAEQQSSSSTSSKEQTSTLSMDVSMPSFDESRVTREPVSKLRQTIAKNMSLSKTIIPHTTVMDEVVVSDLVAFRNNQKAMAQNQDVKLTYMPFIVKALTKSLEEHKRFNASFDHTTNEIIYRNYINVGIAVDTPDGLIVPNIKDADQLSIFGIAEELSRLKEAANNKKITLDDLQDTTMSITNYGVFDSTFGAPVIKHPEVAIIGIGRIMKKPVVEEDEVVVKHVLPLSLAIDHRVLDGGDAGRFMRTFKYYLQHPMYLLLR